MKKVLTALALAALAAGAQAQVTFSGGLDRNPINNYNPNGDAALLVPAAGREDALINTTAGTLTATFIGFEALDLDRFMFNLGVNGNLTNASALNSSVSGVVGAGSLNFTFMDTVTGTQVGNGGNPADSFTSYAVLGSFAQGVFTPYTLGGRFDLILGFNDGLRVDADFDDQVIGLKVTPVPEPETYALMLAGLGALGFISRRRRKTIDA